jgi:hypothetical protein
MIRKSFRAVERCKDILVCRRIKAIDTKQQVLDKISVELSQKTNVVCLF